MALKSRKNKEVAKDEAVVETQEEAVVETQEEETASEEKPTKKKINKEKPAGKSLVKKPSGAVAAMDSSSNALGALKDMLPPVEFGTLPRIKVNNGVIMDDDNDELGKEIIFTLISFNDNWAITPNVSDQSANKYCRFSYDGEELNDGSGTSVSDYMDYLRDEGFEKPSKRRYVELVVILDDAEEDNDNIGEMVQISLSPQSVKKFDAYKLQTMVKMAKGLVTAEQAAVIQAKAKNKTMGTNTFTIFTFKTA